MQREFTQSHRATEGVYAFSGRPGRPPTGGCLGSPYLYVVALHTLLNLSLSCLVSRLAGTVQCSTVVLTFKVGKASSSPARCLRRWCRALAMARQSTCFLALLQELEEPVECAFAFSPPQLWQQQQLDGTCLQEL